MDARESIRLIIESAKERCQALALELDEAEQKQYPSPGPAALLRTIRNINGFVEQKLTNLENDPEIFSLLSAKQAHQHVNRCSQLLPYLHELLGLLDGAEIKHTPAPFVPALRSFTRRYLPDYELLLTSRTSLNYSFLNIAQNLRKLADRAGLAEALMDLPENFVVITFPRAEANNGLLHCVIAHEIGHGIYKKEGLASQLLPLINIDRDKIAELAKVMYQAEVSAASTADKPSGQMPLYPNENELRAQIAVLANNTVTTWLEELGSDAVGFAIFGPAFFFAWVHLVVSIQLIENASPSHPPNSLRIKLLLMMMGIFGKNDATLDGLDDLPDDIKSYANNWNSTCDPPDLSEQFWSIIKSPINKCLEDIGRVAKQVAGDSRYVNDQVRTIAPLRELIIHGIPPNEVMQVQTKSFDYPGMIHILNAGWQVLLTDMDRFAQTFGKDYKTSKIVVKDMLNSIILKAVELDNIRRICHGDEE